LWAKGSAPWGEKKRHRPSSHRPGRGEKPLENPIFYEAFNAKVLHERWEKTGGKIKDDEDEREERRARIHSGQEKEVNEPFIQTFPGIAISIPSFRGGGSERKGGAPRTRSFLENQGKGGLTKLNENRLGGKESRLNTERGERNRTGERKSEPCLSARGKK